MTGQKKLLAGVVAISQTARKSFVQVLCSNWPKKIVPHSRRKTTRSRAHKSHWVSGFLAGPFQPQIYSTVGLKQACLNLFPRKCTQHFVSHKNRLNSSHHFPIFPILYLTILTIFFLLFCNCHEKVNIWSFQRKFLLNFLSVVHLQKQCFAMKTELSQNWKNILFQPYSHSDYFV